MFGGTLRRMFVAVARLLERRGHLKLVPSKGVYILKPPQQKGEKVRRKFRLVLCGNFVDKEDTTLNLYAGGASAAETLRVALAIAAWNGWKGATLDITGAFLLAEWPEDLPKYGICPPKLLVQNGYARDDEIWVVDRPLYGLRESPAIWSRCRSDRLTSALVPHDGRTLTMRASSADQELRLVYGGPILAAMIITYVDDLFYLAEEEVVKSLHRWACSELEWATSEEGTRYLGIEIKQRDDFSFALSQIGYINDVLRSHGMDNAI